MSIIRCNKKNYSNLKLLCGEGGFISQLGDHYSNNIDQEQQVDGERGHHGDTDQIHDGVY